MAASPSYDAVIVGARPAGAATAMLLARAGLDVLVLDRSQRGDDTLSTHALMRGAVVQLRRWGLLDQVVAAGTPAVRRTTFRVGDDVTVVNIKPSHGVDALYAPRRTVLDPIVADAAAAAGAEIRWGATVTGLRRDTRGRVTGVTGHDPDGRAVHADGRITIGADGMSSHLAAWVAAETLWRGSAGGAAAYGHWTGLETDGYEWFFRPDVTAGAIPTNDGQTCVFVGAARETFRRHLLRDAHAGYLELLERAAPELTDRLAVATPPERLHRFPGRPGHLRRAWGAGWALVGDAGYYKDPITAHGITDALRDAELLARAVIAGFAEGDADAALAGYEHTRNRLSDPLFRLSDALGSMAWDTTEVGALLLGVSAAMADEVELLGMSDEVVPAR